MRFILMRFIRNLNSIFKFVLNYEDITLSLVVRVAHDNKLCIGIKYSGVKYLSVTDCTDCI